MENFKEATADCGWDDQLRARWFFWFLAGLIKSTWQRTLTKEDKTSWNRIVDVYRGQYDRPTYSISEVPWATCSTLSLGQHRVYLMPCEITRTPPSSPMKFLSPYYGTRHP